MSPISCDNWGRRYNLSYQDILIDNTVKHAGIMEKYQMHLILHKLDGSGHLRLSVYWSDPHETGLT